jgi:hypothetical protein
MFKQPTLDIFDTQEEELIQSTYTKKIEVPTYTPSYKKPSVHELFDSMKTQKLIKEINESDISENDKRFLIYSAQRHTVFNFDKCADYYAHSSPKVQELMEKSALVIVDFDKAIEYGFATLNNDLANAYLEDEND